MRLSRRIGRPATAVGSAVAVAGLVQTVVNARLVRVPVPTASPRPRPLVSVLVPARDEGATIAACVRALAGQAAEVLVLDDGSSDDTAALATAAGARTLTGAPVPPGWLGKPWACAQLAAAAHPDSTVLVFVDADVLVAPHGVAAAVDLLTDAGLDIVCPFPRQHAVSPAERLVQPLLQWSWLATLPLRTAERSPRASLTAACGQLMAVRRDALERVGGFAAVHDAVLDDVALVRRVKATGGRGGVADGSRIAGCRMYDGWPALRDGYAKSLWSAFGTPAGAVTATALLWWGWVLPPVAALTGSRIGMLGYVAGVASRVVAARRTGARSWPDALAHPVSVVTLGGLTARSVVLHRRGALSWKGRNITVQDAAGAGVRTS